MTELEARAYLIDILTLSENIIDAIKEETGLSDNGLAEALNSAEQIGNSPEDIREYLREKYPDAFNPLKPKDYTDVGNSKIILNLYGDRLRYCAALGWLVYNDATGAWEADESAARALCIEYTDKMLADAKQRYTEALTAAFESNQKNPTAMIDKDTKEYYDHALKSRSRQKIDNMLSLAGAELTVKAKDLDADPDIINTAAGVYDFRTGTMNPHAPEYYCMNCAPFRPSDKGAAVWYEFLNLITENDEDLKKYLQLNLGMCITGNVAVEEVKFCVGDGRNGKSTLFKALSKVVDNYAVYINPDILLKADKAINTDKDNMKAALFGKRLAICGEPDKDTTLNEKALKQIASNEDKMTIKRLYKDREAVTPTHHLCMFMNDLPKIKNSSDKAIQRRIKVIPFNATMPSGDAEILDYATELVDQAGEAILKWLLDGATEWYAANFKIKTPAVVKQASEEYLLREDWLQNFINDRCMVDGRNTVRIADLYNAYHTYSWERNEEQRSMRDFNDAMKNKKFKRVSKGGHVEVWQGIGLKSSLLDD